MTTTLTPPTAVPLRAGLSGALIGAVGVFTGLVVGATAAVVLTSSPAPPPGVPVECRAAVRAAEEVVANVPAAVGWGVLTRSGPLNDYRANSRACLADQP